MTHDALLGIGGILALGISAQWLAWRLKLPSIILLLLFGFLAGPVTGFLKPDILLGELLFPVVSISVAIILFEGGLSLKITDLRKIGTVVRNLILVGVPVTWALVTIASWCILKLDFSMSLLLGAILVVTGPTVILPLLRTLSLSDRIGSILRWESMLIDPVGAILAVLTFEAILGGGFQAAGGRALWGLLKTILIGTGVGYVTTRFMIVFFKRYWVPDFLHSPFTLMTVVITFIGSNVLQAESGLLTVTMIGVFMASQKDIPVKHIIEFKENLRVLLISSLFIVLAARLELQYLAQINAPKVAFLLFLIFVARPVAVFCSTWRSNLQWQERLFLAWMAPRGIVAAAVASIFALHLEAAGRPGAEELIGITFLVIIFTVTLYGLTSPWVAKLLKLAQPNPQGVLIGGAHHWAKKMALVLQEAGVRVMLVDTNGANVHSALMAGLPARHGDILSDKLTDELELTGIGRFLAMTPNDEVNSLATIHLEEFFGRSEVYRLSKGETEKEGQKQATAAHGRILFQKGLTYHRLNELFQQSAEIVNAGLNKDYDYEAFKREFGDGAIPLFIISDSKEVKIVTVGTDLAPKPGQTIVFLKAQKTGPV